MDNSTRRITIRYEKLASKFQIHTNSNTTESFVMSSIIKHIL